MNAKYDVIIDHILAATQHAHRKTEHVQAQSRLRDAITEAEQYAKTLAAKTSPDEASKFRKDFQSHVDRIQKIMEQKGTKPFTKSSGCNHDTLQKDEACTGCGYLIKSLSISQDIAASLAKSMSRFADNSEDADRLLSKAAELRIRVDALKKAKIYDFTTGKKVAELPTEAGTEDPAKKFVQSQELRSKVQVHEGFKPHTTEPADRLGDLTPKPEKKSAARRAPKKIHSINKKPVYLADLRSESWNTQYHSPERKHDRGENYNQMVAAHKDYKREDHEKAATFFSGMANEATNTKTKNQLELHAKYHNRLGREKTVGMIPGMHPSVWAHHYREARKDQAEAKKNLSDKKWMASASIHMKERAKHVVQFHPAVEARHSYEYHEMRAHSNVDRPAQQKWEALTGKPIPQQKMWNYDHRQNRTSAKKNRKGEWVDTYTSQPFKKSEDLQYSDLEKAKIYSFDSGQMVADLGQPGDKRAEAAPKAAPQKIAAFNAKNPEDKKAGHFEAAMHHASWWAGHQGQQDYYLDSDQHDFSDRIAEHEKKHGEGSWTSDHSETEARYTANELGHLPKADKHLKLAQAHLKASGATDKAGIIDTHRGVETLDSHGYSLLYEMKNAKVGQEHSHIAGTHISHFSPTGVHSHAEPHGHIESYAHESHNDTHPMDAHLPQPKAKGKRVAKSVSLRPGQSISSLAKDANPDEEADAELGEKVEHLVEEHMQENAAAEKKEGHTLEKELTPHRGQNAGSSVNRMHHGSSGAPPIANTPATPKIKMPAAGATYKTLQKEEEKEVK